MDEKPSPMQDEISSRDWERYRIEEELKIKRKEAEVKEEELKIKRKEAELKEEDIRLRRQEIERKKWVERIPILTALIAAIIAVIGYLNQRDLSLTIERLKSESSLILGAVEVAGGDEIDTRRNVEFFLKTGFLEDKDGNIQKLLDEGKGPIGASNQPKKSFSEITLEEIQKLLTEAYIVNSNRAEVEWDSLSEQVIEDSFQNPPSGSEVTINDTQAIFLNRLSNGFYDIPDTLVYARFFWSHRSNTWNQLAQIIYQEAQ